MATRISAAAKAFRGAHAEPPANSGWSDAGRTRSLSCRVEHSRRANRDVELVSRLLTQGFAAQRRPAHSHSSVADLGRTRSVRGTRTCASELGSMRPRKGHLLW